LNNSPAILSSAYLAPLQWYSKLFQYDEIIIDQHEHYIKQTWRNRARIVSANGVQDLIVPVHAPNHTPMREVKINYDEAWQRQHWQSIRSAYGNSPFFNFYADYFSPFYETKKIKTLIEFNSEVLTVTLKLLKQKKKISFSEEFIGTTADHDFRSTISPKISIEEDSSFTPKRYLQVFEERHGFISNLSIIDLLCCAGPASGEILMQ
jgi:hypothetical protein